LDVIPFCHFPVMLEALKLIAKKHRAFDWAFFTINFPNLVAEALTTKFSSKGVYAQNNI
jgi:hypothetical protein